MNYKKAKEIIDNYEKLQDDLCGYQRQLEKCQAILNEQEKKRMFGFKITLAYNLIDYNNYAPTLLIEDNDFINYVNKYLGDKTLILKSNITTLEEELAKYDR